MTSETDAISATRWARIQHIFDEAMDLGAEDRTAFISEKCGSDENLRNQIEALMLAADSDEDLVSSLVRSATHSLIDSEKRLSQPIGPFKLVEVIGEGGMGVVYLARRDDHEFVQNVAIKILHKRIVSEETQRRFLAERQILADLNHPNIARLLDGGQTDDGQPYIVMEYIDGEPLVDYCDHNRLSIDERLRLFIQVCQAVAEAHRSLIVHRDIKSNNILVGKDNTPKLLDFGIAKVLNNHLGDIDLAKTQLHDRLLTPDSASPEQITGQAITTATDIYSLGILLYELLCGCRPFRLAYSTAGEMERTICHEIPLAPSVALDTLVDQNDGDRDQIAGNRGCSVARLQSMLRGELDCIVLMALKKEPRRRYRSVNDFADDIKRYFHAEPIRAVHDSRSYRLMKFVKRNRIPVAATAIFVASVSAFGVTTYIQSREIEAQAQSIAMQARSIAEQNDDMDFTIGYFGELFRDASPEGLQKKEPSALDILDYAEQKIGDDLVERPEIMGRLRQFIASGFFGQGESSKALKNYEAAKTLIAESYGRNHPLMASILHDLGRYYWTRDWTSASDYYHQALTILEHPETVAAFGGNTDRQMLLKQKLLRDLAELEISQGQWADAELHAKTALDISREMTANAANSTEVALNLNMLGALNLRLSQFELSERYITLALEEYKRTHDPKHTLVAKLINELALVKHAQGDLEAAEQHYTESVAILESVFDQGDSRLLLTKAELGRFLGTQGKLEQAEQLLEEVTRGLGQLEGDPTFELAFNLVQLAVVKTRLQKYNAAEQLFNDALDIYAATIEPDHTFIGEAYRQYGNLRIQQQRYDAAVAWFDDALSILLPQLGEHHWQTAATLSEKAEALLMLDQRPEAQALLDAAVPVLDEILGSEHRLAQVAQTRLERAYDNR